MRSKNILICGHYEKNNLGHNLFLDAYNLLFPNYNLITTNFITLENLLNIDAVFFGGGSFLYAPPNVANNAFELLKTKKIFYIGVGVETDIHPLHQELIKISQLIATRSYDYLAKAKELNEYAIWMPDLAYCLQSSVVNTKTKEKSVLILPNISIVPQWNDPHWVHISWEFFKNEFAQFLDILVSENYTINFLAMCNNNKVNDDFAAAEIINSMSNRDKSYIIQSSKRDFENITKLFSQSQFVISQRFHGIVLSELTRTPYLAIHHHDKIKTHYPQNGFYLPYYGINKDSLIVNFRMMHNYSPVLTIDTDIFRVLKEAICHMIDDII